MLIVYKFDLIKCLRIPKNKQSKYKFFECMLIDSGRIIDLLSKNYFLWQQEKNLELIIQEING